MTVFTGGTYSAGESFFLFAYLSHIKDSSHQTNFNITQKKTSKYKMLFLNDEIIYQGKKAVQTCLALHEKVIAPLNLITGCATLCSNNCNQAFAITGNECFTLLWRKFALSSLQNCFNSATLEGFWAWMDCLRSCHSISIRFKCGLWLDHSKTLILFFLSHSEVDLLLCLGSLFCYITKVRLSLRSQTDGQTFSLRIFW